MYAKSEEIDTIEKFLDKTVVELKHSPIDDKEKEEWEIMHELVLSRKYFVDDNPYYVLIFREYLEFLYHEVGFPIISPAHGIFGVNADNKIYFSRRAGARLDLYDLSGDGIRYAEGIKSQLSRKKRIWSTKISMGPDILQIHPLQSRYSLLHRRVG